MAAKRKTTTKTELESKIAELEKKLSKLATQLEKKPAPKPAETKPAEVKPAPKPAETKPAPKPAEVKPAKPAEVKPAPKPAETAQPPVTFSAALEDAYYNATMSSFHDYRAKVPGYAPAPNRYFVRRTAPVGRVPTSNWNDQKVNVTGYTQPSNQYFATKARMAYHPPDKTFGGYSGTSMSVEGVTLQTPPKPVETVQQTPPPQQSNSSNDTTKSKKQTLEEYETEYMNRIEVERAEHAELMSAAAELRATRHTESKPSDSSRGVLPKGF